MFSMWFHCYRKQSVPQNTTFQQDLRLCLTCVSEHPSHPSKFLLLLLNYLDLHSAINDKNDQKCSHVFFTYFQIKKEKLLSSKLVEMHKNNALPSVAIQGVLSLVTQL